MRWIAAFLIFVIAASGPVRAEFSLFNIQNSLFQFALDQISVPGELEITAEGVEDGEDGATDIVGLAVADAQGEWLKVGRISLRWNASSIVSGELDITRLAASDVEVLRPPASSSVAVEAKPDSKLAETDDDPFDWPRSPITTTIQNIAAERVNIAAGVIASQAVSLDMTGALKDAGDEQSLSLNVTRTDAVASKIILKFLRDFASNELTLQLNADEAAGGLVAELAGLPNDSASRVSLSGDGPLTDWAVTFDASTDRVYEASGAGSFNAVGRLAAKFDMIVTPGEALDPQIAAALSPNARIIANVAEDEGGVIRINQGALTTRDVSLTAKGQYSQTDAVADIELVAEAQSRLADLVDGVDFASFGFDGSVKGPVDDLAIKGDLTLMGLTTAAVDVGSAVLDADVRLAGDQIDVTVAGEALSLRLDRLTPDLIGTAKLALSAQLAGDQATLANLSLTSVPLTVSVSGDADLQTETADVTYQIAAPDLAPLAAAYDADAKGVAEMKGTLNGPFSAPRLAGDAAFTGLAFGEERLGAVSLTHDATFGATPKGTLNMVADGSRFGEITFDGAFLLDGDRLGLTDLIATGLGATIEGGVLVALDTTLATGAITIDAPDMSALTAAAQQDIAGALSGDIQLNVSDGAQNVTLDVALADLSAAGVAVQKATAKGALNDVLGELGFDLGLNFSGLSAGDATINTGRAAVSGKPEDMAVTASLGAITADPASIAGVDVRAQIKNAPSGDPAIEVTLIARDIAADPAALTTTRLTTSGKLSALDLRLTSDGALTSGEIVAVRSRARVDAVGDVTVRISELEASLDDIVAKLDAPLTIEAANGVTRFQGIDLSLSSAVLTGGVALHSDGMTGDLNVEAANLAPLAALAGAPVEQGAAYIKAEFNTRRSNPSATVRMNANDLRFADVVADLGALTLDAGVDWDGRVAKVAADLSGPFGAPFLVRAAAPMRPSGGPVPTVPTQGALSGSVDWTGQIQDIWALIPAPGHVLSGEAKVALRLVGTIASPEVGGDVAISGGRYENLDIGAILVDLTATSQIEPSGAFVMDMTAGDGSGGDVKAVVELNDGRIDANLVANGATLVRRDDATAAISLNISAAGPLDAPDISGDINIDRAEIRLVNANPPGVADIGPVRIKGEEPPEPEPTSGEDIDLDIVITGPQDIFVRGRGLDSEWEIDLTISGTAADPRIVGAIQKRRGQLSLLGRDFDLERGKVQFSGGKGVDPRLDVLIQRDNDGIRGGIAVTGVASEPQINFVSRPALAEEEVLPRILFGRSRQSLSPSDALSLAVGVATLLDGGGGASDSVRGAVGVDVLRVDSGEAGPSVTVGSNVAEGVFVGVKQPIGSGAASVQVKVEVFDNVTIDSETGADVGTSIGLNWKKDF